MVSVARHYVMAFGASEGLEEVRNSYIYDAAMDTFPDPPQRYGGLPGEPV